MGGSPFASSLDYLRPKLVLAGGNDRDERAARVTIYAAQVRASGGILRENRGGRRTNAARPVIAKTPDRKTLRFGSVRDAAQWLCESGRTRSSVQSAASSLRKRLRRNGVFAGVQFVDVAQ